MEKKTLLRIGRLEHRLLKSKTAEAELFWVIISGITMKIHVTMWSRGKGHESLEG